MDPFPFRNSREHATMSLPSPSNLLSFQEVAVEAEDYQELLSTSNKCTRYAKLHHLFMGPLFCISKTSEVSKARIGFLFSYDLDSTGG